MTDNEPRTNEQNEAPVESPTQKADSSDQSLGEVFRKLGPAGYLAVVWTTLPIVGSILLWVKMGTIGGWLRDNGSLGIALYVLIFVCSAGFGLLPTYAQAILAGWAFGVAVGVPAAIAGVTGAAMVGYVAARAASRDRAERLIAENIKARAIKDALIGHGFWKSLGMVTLLRLPINSPFALTNLVMASAGVSKIVFLIGTAVGMAPRTALAVYLAAGVQELSKDAVDDAKPRWVTITAIVSAVVVFGFVAWIANRAVQRVTGVRCPDCGYDLRGADSTVCPECGRDGAQPAAS